MSQVFIFQGHTDPIVPWENALLIHWFYSEFTKEERIAEKTDLNTSHGFPTTNYGCDCDVLCPLSTSTTATTTELWQFYSRWYPVLPMAPSMILQDLKAHCPLLTKRSSVTEMRRR